MGIHEETYAALILLRLEGASSVLETNRMGLGVGMGARLDFG